MATQEDDLVLVLAPDRLLVDLGDGGSRHEDLDPASLRLVLSTAGASSVVLAASAGLALELRAGRGR